MVEQKVRNGKHSARVSKHRHIFAEDGVVGRGDEVVPVDVGLREGLGGRAEPHPEGYRIAYLTLLNLAVNTQGH